MSPPNQKLISPSSERNKEPIGDILGKRIIRNAHVLEIASGTGQHAIHVCKLRPDIIWQMTDIDPLLLASQTAYAQDFLQQMAPPVETNVMRVNWWYDFANIDAMFCANMIHIAPWAAAQGLAKGAGKVLNSAGELYLYGPFLIGENSAESNLKFDVSLKNRNPEWGVRDLQSVKHIFADAGLDLIEKVDMPRDNFLLIFSS